MAAGGNWDQCSKTTVSRTATCVCSEVRQTTKQKKIPVNNASGSAPRTDICSPLQQKIDKHRQQRASPQQQLCLPIPQGQQQCDGRRIMSPAFPSRSTSHDNPRVTQDFHHYREKSCSYSKNSTEEGNSLWVFPSLRLKEIFTFSLTVTIQRNYNYSSSWGAKYRHYP